MVEVNCSLTSIFGICDVKLTPLDSRRTFASRAGALGPLRLLRGRRAAALELQEHECCRNGRLTGLLPALVRVVLDAAGALEQVGQQRRQFVPRFVVEAQRHSADMHVLAIEPAGLARAPEVPRDVP